MTDASITPGQEAFIQALQAKVSQSFSSLLDGDFVPMSMPSGAYYGIQYGPNNYYNTSFLGQLDQTVTIGDNGQAQPGSTKFTSLYADIMSGVVFTFSSADNQSLQRDQAQYQSQLQQVISTWEVNVGTITDDQMKSAFPPTKLGYIYTQFAQRWSSDINNVPASLQAFKDALQNYQVQAQVANRLSIQSAQAMARLAALRANLATPSAANGALQIDASTYYPAFGPFPDQNTIVSSLASGNRSLELNLKLTNFSSQTTNMSVGGSVGLEVPIADIVEVGFSGGARYTLDKYSSASTTVTMDVAYEGITFVSTPLTSGALATSNRAGWYAEDILAEALENVDGSRTGYSLQGGAFPADEYFGSGKKFSRIKTWVLSREPSITLQFCAAQTDDVTSDFTENAKLSLKVLGLFTVGEVDQSYEVKNVDDKTVDGCVIVSLGAPDSSSGTTSLQTARAFLVGGVPSYPPTAD
ncbi:hypothetical protein [Humibacillus xanthopallidus]|uniref:hypothetical protein n=1 Tax=Humibacillus xanthopallidus TaxID=412689 RepID=UPI003850BF0D